MAGNQFGFIYNTDHKLLNLQASIIARLDHHLNEYNLIDGDVVYVGVGIIQRDINLLSEFKFNEFSKSNLGLGDSKVVHSLPLSISPEHMGSSLPVASSDGYITKITLKNKENFLKSMEKMSALLTKGHPDKIAKFPNS